LGWERVSLGSGPSGVRSSAPRSLRSPARGTTGGFWPGSSSRVLLSLWSCSASSAWRPAATLLSRKLPPEYPFHRRTGAFYLSCPARGDARSAHGLAGGARRIERCWTEPLVGGRGPRPMDFLLAPPTASLVSTSPSPLSQARSRSAITRGPL